jgi:hypothetical protein
MAFSLRLFRKMLLLKQGRDSEVKFIARFSLRLWFHTSAWLGSTQKYRQETLLNAGNVPLLAATQAAPLELDQYNSPSRQTADTQNGDVERIARSCSSER